MELTHINSNGEAHMVDVSHKNIIKRTAAASGKIILQEETIKLIKNHLVKKGDVISVAKIAGIMAAKQTDKLIPLCHGINLEHVELEFQLLDNGIEIKSAVSASDKTGAEMEALTAVSVAALTVYDMCKAVDKQMKIENIHLIEKKKYE